MKLIEKLSDMIEEELNDADKYIRCALTHKEDNPDLAQLFYKLSDEEMEHMASLHRMVVAVIDKYQKEHGDPPANMKALYDYLHGKHIERASEIKVRQAMFRG